MSQNISGMSNAETLSVLQKKYDQLRANIAKMGSIAIAFSGGVDSTLLLKVAHEELGSNAIAITARSCSFPARELNEAIEYCEEEGIEQIIVDSEELEIDGFAQNPPNRCYLCKRELLGKINDIANERGLAVVAEGSNTDDLGDYRPGRAAVEEMGVRSPLLEVGLGKDDIRVISLSLGLETWDKPSFACLTSRFPYGETITREKLAMVDRAEQMLLDAGFEQVRVRMHGAMARIEVPADELEDLFELSRTTDFVAKMHELGFNYVAMDLDGYRTGSMNETLKTE